MKTKLSKKFLIKNAPLTHKYLLEISEEKKGIYWENLSEFYKQKAIAILASEYDDFLGLANDLFLKKENQNLISAEMFNSGKGEKVGIMVFNQFNDSLMSLYDSEYYKQKTKQTTKTKR